MLRTPSSPISNDGLDFDFFDDVGPRITDTGVFSSSSSSSSLPTNIGAAATTATSNTQAESTMIGQEDRDGRDEGFDYAVSIHGTPIRLAKDPMVGTGGLLWPAGQVLATYLSTRLAADPTLFQGKRVLELGSGTGVVGLCLAMRLPAIDSFGEREEDKGTTVTLTDLAKVLPVLARNVALNGSPPAVRVRELSWCDPVSPDLQRAGDVVLLADCIYLESLFQPLVDTLLAVMSESSGAVAYLCYKKRRRADARFFVLLRKRFAVQTITLDDKVGGRGEMQSDGGSGIHLYAVTRK